MTPEYLQYLQHVVQEMTWQQRMRGRWRRLRFALRQLLRVWGPR